MDFWLIFFIVTTIISVGTAGVCLVLLKRMDLQRIRMEDYLIDIGQVMSDFYLKIGNLFSQSIHYYDETIYQFVDSTKTVKLEIDKVMNEYEDLKEFIVPVATPEENAQEQQQEKDVLGVVKSAIPAR